MKKRKRALLAFSRTSLASISIPCFGAEIFAREEIVELAPFHVDDRLKRELADLLYGAA